MKSPQYAKIQLPRLLAYDQFNRVQIFVDEGELPQLKQFCISNGDFPDIFEEAGNILGRFLADMHIWGYQTLQESSNDEIMAPFRHNNDGKRICAWRTGGRLSETATKFKIDGNWDDISGDLQRCILENNETFNMGDYW